MDLGRHVLYMTAAAAARDTAAARAIGTVLNGGGEGVQAQRCGHRGEKRRECAMQLGGRAGIDFA
jgi:hypothetical protein